MNRDDHRGLVSPIWGLILVSSAASAQTKIDNFTSEFEREGNFNGAHMHFNWLQRVVGPATFPE